MVIMIIKGLFRRYERWNPVHPTSGAFWGMGIGIGCGVGWGPGFGPDVIGYVGAGCGIGFSVGFTLAGFGIGLPANSLYKVPYNGFTATRNGVFEMVRYNNKWNTIALHASSVQRETSARFYSLKPKNLMDTKFDLFGMKNLLAIHSKSILEGFWEFSGRFLRHHKGSED